MPSEKVLGSLGLLERWLNPGGFSRSSVSKMGPGWVGGQGKGGLGGSYTF